MMTPRLTLITVALLLSACDGVTVGGNRVADIEAPERQECVDVKTGDKFRFRRDAITEVTLSITGNGTMKFTDESGWSRTLTSADQSDYKCKEIPLIK